MPKITLEARVVRVGTTESARSRFPAKGETGTAVPVPCFSHVAELQLEPITSDADAHRWAEGIDGKITLELHAPRSGGRDPFPLGTVQYVSIEPRDTVAPPPAAAGSDVRFDLATTLEGLLESDDLHGDLERMISKLREGAPA